MNKKQVSKFTQELNPELLKQFIKGYDSSVIGMTLDLQKIVYSLTKMVGCFTQGEFNNEKKLQFFFEIELPRIQKTYNDTLIIMDYIYG